MARKISGEEKRLRGFLSGDPDRVARTARRCIGIASTDIHRYMADHLDEIVEAVAGVELDPQVRIDLDSYFTWLRRTTTFDPRPPPSELPPCDCQHYQGNHDQFLSKITVLSERIHRGESWSEFELQCTMCGRTYHHEHNSSFLNVQYGWKPTS